MSNPQRASSFNYQRRFKNVVWIQTRDSQDFSFNELQFIIDAERKKLGDGIFADGAVVAGLVPTVGALSGGFTPVSFTDGLIWIRGRMEPVSGITVQVPGAIDASSKIWLQHLLTQIDATADSELVDPNTLDPIDERLAVLCGLINADPDGFDEDFSTWVLDADGVTPVLLNQNGVGIRPKNRDHGVWNMAVGAATDLAIGAPFWDGIGALQFNHTSGINDTLQLGGVTLQPSTLYTVYLALRTVYGQLDLTSPNGVFLSIERTASASPLISNFGTSGGGNLLGDYTIQKFTFTSDGSGAPMNIQLGIVAGAPTTQVLVGWGLITATPLGAADRTRHNYLAFVGTAGGQIVPAVQPGLTLPINARDVAFAPYKDIDGIVSPDTTPNVQDAIQELADRRALLAGDPTQIFNVKAAATDTEAPQAGQVQNGSLTYALDTGVADAYVGAYVPPIAAYVDGMELTFRALFASTGASTLDAGDGPKPILHADGSDIEGNDIRAGQVVTVVYQAEMNGGAGAWQLIEPPIAMISAPTRATLGIDENIPGSAYGPILTLTSTPPSTGKNWLAFIRYGIFLLNNTGGNPGDQVVANVTDGSVVSLPSSTRVEPTHDQIGASGYMPASYPAGVTVTFTLQAIKGGPSGTTDIRALAVNNIDTSLSTDLEVRWIPLN